MFDIPTIMNSEEILEKAFRRASKVQVSDPDFKFRMKKLNKAKVDALASVVDATLEKYVRSFPSFDNLAPFYRALIDLLEPIDGIRRKLGRIDGTRRSIRTIHTKTIRQINRTSKPDYMDLKRNEAFGRIASMVRRLDDDLRYLNDVREKFKKLPSIPTKNPTAVIAGYPSVGKSHLIREISTADPKVASYPFTTRELTVGYFEHGRSRYQLVDTPGILDRPFEDRNNIEKQAVLALELLSSVCIFILDPTGHCGYEVGPQVDLLRSTMKTVEGMDFIIVINKSDLTVPDREGLERMESSLDEMNDSILEIIEISALTGEGTERLREVLVSSLSREEEKPWENFR